MSRFHGKVSVGLRDKETDKLIAIYPEKLEGSDKEIEDKVKFWYYQQSCDSGEKMLKHYYVDSLTEGEIKNIEKS